MKQPARVLPCPTRRVVVGTARKLPSPRRGIGAKTVLAACLAAAGCSDSDDSPVPVPQAVSAAAGGTATSPGGEVKVVIPAGALSADTRVTIQRASGTGPALGSTLTSAGDVYQVTFDNGATLSAAMRIEVTSTTAPTHPQLGEVAELVNGAWQRAGANFYRASDHKVVALTRNVTTVRVVNRRLQAVSGDSVARGRDVFLGETFGNENFFGGVVGLHTLLNALTPAQAVGAGVQVDLSKVPAAIAAVLTGSDLAAKDAALQNPAITRALLKADAVIGVRTKYANVGSDTATSAGITCALCHVTVTPTTFTLTAGATPLPIGAPRFDGVPNYKMDAGAILSLTPFGQSSANTTALLQSWKAGRFDIRALPDNPLDDGANNPTKFPPLWNFVDLEQQTYLYDWDGLFKNSAASNALASQAEAVYDLVMHANGAFGTASGTLSPKLSVTPPASLLTALAAAETAAPGNVVTLQKLKDVQDFQRSITSPAPGSYNEALAEQGFVLFNGKADCAGCHRTAEFTGPVITARITLTPPTGGLAGGIKTPGLRGIASTAPYFHDGSAATLRAVMDTYAGRITPALTDAEKNAVVEYLKSL